jgi:hypothetical protein
MHKEITELTKFGECLVSLGPGSLPPPPFPLAIEEHKDQNKQHYIYARYFAPSEKLAFHISARAAYVKNVEEQGAKERYMSIGVCTKLHNEQLGEFLLLIKYQ